MFSSVGKSSVLKSKLVSSIVLSWFPFSWFSQFITNDASRNSRGPILNVIWDGFPKYVPLLVSGVRYSISPSV